MDRFKAIYYVLQSNENKYKKLLDDLKSSANYGRDKYPKRLTSAFDLLVRKSGEYDNVRSHNDPRFHRGGGGRGRGRSRGGQNNFTFA